MSNHGHAPFALTCGIVSLCSTIILSISGRHADTGRGPCGHKPLDIGLAQPASIDRHQGFHGEIRSSITSTAIELRHAARAPACRLCGQYRWGKACAAVLRPHPRSVRPTGTSAAPSVMVSRRLLAPPTGHGTPEGSGPRGPGPSSVGASGIRAGPRTSNSRWRPVSLSPPISTRC